MERKTSVEEYASFHRGEEIKWDAHPIQSDQRVWLGSQRAANDFDACRSHDITHVISIREPGFGLGPIANILLPHLPTISSDAYDILSGYLPAGLLPTCPAFVYWRIWEDDVTQTNLYRYFGRACRWIRHVLAGDPHYRILIHCQAGISRSSTLALAYLIWNRARQSSSLPFPSVAEFLNECRQQRRIIQPNRGFMLQLYRWHYQCACSLFRRLTSNMFVSWHTYPRKHQRRIQKAQIGKCKK